MANLLLQDPFSVLKEYPDQLSSIIDIPFQSVCLQFSHQGDYLAVGCSNGAIMIYDMDTGKPMTILGNRGGAHQRSIQSISWSICGRYIWSSSRDWSVKMWDLSCPGQCFKQYKFDSPVWTCNFLINMQCIVTVFEQKNPFMLDFGSQEIIVKEIMESYEHSEDFGYTLVTCPHSTFCNILLTGTSKGWLKIYRVMSDGVYQRIYDKKIGNFNIKMIIISQSGDRVAVNCADRTIRQFSLIISEDHLNIDLELEHKYQDVINRLQWNSIFFSNHSGEYLVASAHGSSAHDLYLWETSSGTLVRVLEGPEEELLDIDWNFYTMCIASNGLETGNIYIWSISIPPKWSALAPDFEEIEENIEYQEKENEFDQMTEIGKLHETNQEEISIDLYGKEKYDVRGNDLSIPRFVIPIDYEGIFMLQQWNKSY